jgi:hypothetical protein
VSQRRLLEYSIIIYGKGGGGGSANWLTPWDLVESHFIQA